MKNTHLIFVISLFLHIFLMSNNATAQQNTAPNVIIAPLTKQPFADTVEALGTTKANESIVITAQTTEKISHLFFNDGEIAKKDDLLVVLDKSEEDAALSAAQAMHTENQAAYNRAQNLQKTSALSKGTLEERFAALKQSQATIDEIQARIDKHTIKAPFDGVLGLREVSVGTLIQPGDQITTLDDISKIKVDFDVPAIFLSGLSVGMPIVGKVDAYPDLEFHGKVTAINTKVDPITRSITIRAILANDQNLLKSGLLMRINLFKNPREALLIPEESLIKKSDKNYVYLIEQKEDKTIASLKEVTIGQRQVGYIEALSGVQENDLVVTHGVVKLRDGSPVSITATENNDEPLHVLLKQGR